MGKRWTQEEDNFLLNNYNNMTAEEISKILNRSVEGIYHRAHRLNILNKNYFTHKEFVELVSKINSNIEILSMYKNMNSKITCKCKIHNYIWISTARQLIETGRCPKCHINKKREHEDFVNDLKLINPNIKVLGKFKGMKVHIKVVCLIDGYIWDALPSRLLKDRGCPKCAGNARYTTKSFQEKLKVVNPFIKVIGKYVNLHTKIRVKCLEHNIIWDAHPISLLKGCGCKECFMSNGERVTMHFLRENNIQFETQYTFNDLISEKGRKLRFDFAIFFNNKLFCLIEIDGIGHRKPTKFNTKMTDEETENKFKNTLKNDELKNKYCMKNKIKLIRIVYDGNIPYIIKTLENELNEIINKVA